LKKKVLIILPYAGGGGSEKVLINLANFLSRYFFVTICFVNLRKKNYLKFIKKKIIIVNLEKNSAKACIMPIIKLLNNCNFDYIISSIHHLNIVTIISKIFSKTKAKVIIRETNKIIQSKFNLLKVFTIFIFYRFADLIISPSKKINIEIKNLFIEKSKLKILNNPVLINSYSRTPANIRKFIGRDKYILSFARFEKHKNLDFLIKCVKKIKRVKLVVVGEGSQKNNINNIIKNLGLNKRVKLFKFLPNGYELLKKSELYINCSDYEGQSNSVLEALFLNVPVISADNGSHTQFITKYKFGYVFKSFKIINVSNLILKILKRRKKNINNKYFKEVNYFVIGRKLKQLIDKL